MGPAFGQVQRYFIILLLVILFATVQYTFIPFFLPSWLSPDLCFILYLGVILKRNVVDSILASVAMGYLVGVLSGSHPMPLFVWPLLGVFFPFVSRGVFVKQYLSLVGMTMVFFLVAKVVSISVLALSQWSTQDFGWRLLYALRDSLPTGFLGPLVYNALQKIPALATEDTRTGSSLMILYRGGETR